MSRTDKTRPYAVKLAFDPHAVEEEHDHRDGPCDLPPLEYSTFAEWPRTTRCRWEYTREWINSGMAQCPCPICKNRLGQRRIHRSRRYSAKKVVRTAVREFNAQGQLDDL